MNPIIKNLPDLKEIEKLEKFSQQQGSGIIYEDLLGVWKFHYVWKKNSDGIDNISSSILQVLSASLELERKYPENPPNFEIKNSVNFGLLKIIFSGSAVLKGTRPLLPFYFKKINVKIGSFSIIEKVLEKTEEKKRPFFSLIGISKENNWMCARGKGGGIAIWVKT